MTQEVDLNRVVRQHAEMETFFAGFGVRSDAAARGDGVPATEPRVAAASPGAAPEASGSAGCRHVAEVDRGPQAVAEAGKELEAVAADARQCRLCELGSLRTNAVPGEGCPRARIMFVGEAPGADEDAQGRPFVGRAGQLLDKIIAACGLKREEVFIGNVLKCRPPDNRDPRPEEIIHCLPYLQRQIEVIDPEVIVALGAHAARTLLNTNRSIGQLRGDFQEYCPGIGRPSIKLIATYHPAYLLRSYTPENRMRVWEDMKKVLVELDLPIPSHGKG